MSEEESFIRVVAVSGGLVQYVMGYVDNHPTLPIFDGNERDVVFQLQVLKVRWKGPHTPIFRWHKFRTLRTPLAPKQVARETLRLLNTKAHIGFCIKCDKHVIEGYMHDSNYCSSCAETQLGIVY